MDRDFWIEKWRAKSIGFHQENFHPLLMHFAGHLPLKHDSRVFVPLCGKTKDLLWFESKGAQVLGIEIASQAIEEFYNENRDHTIPPVDSLGGDKGELYRDGNLYLIGGDFFHLKNWCEKEASLAPFASGFDIIYDRASTVALPPETREKYYEHIRSHLKEGGTLFLITFEYEKGKMDGPPFSVNEKEIRRAYSEYHIQILHRETHTLTEGKFFEAGLREMNEIVYLIKK